MTIGATVSWIGYSVAVGCEDTIRHMRWVTYLSPLNGRDQAGLLHDGFVHGTVGSRLLDLIGDDGARLRDAADRALIAPDEVLPYADVRLRAPIYPPPSVRDFMSFEEHVVTSSAAIGMKIDPGWYENPVFYFSNPAAVCGSSEPVAISPGSGEFDFELEIAAYIGKPGSDIDPGNAEQHIAGYAILCDWSARDLQQKEMRQSLGPAKGKDSATTIGPALVTPDELEPYRSGKGFELRMTATVNGVRYSEGSWSTIYWSFAEMIAYASRGTRLVTGDVIGSGTVGSGCILELSRVHGKQRFPYLVPGDEVALEIEQLGTISNTIVSGSPVIPLQHV